MNKGTFASALTEIGDDIIEKYAPRKPYPTDVHNNKNKKFSARFIRVLAACLGAAAIVSVLLIVPGFFKGSGSNGGSPKDSEMTGDWPADIDTSNRDILFPYEYMDISSSTSLLKAGSLKYYGAYYKVIARDLDGSYISVQKAAIFEAVVEEDYYRHRETGSKIYIALPLEFSWGDVYYSLDADEMKNAVEKCGSIIFYTASYKDSDYFFTDAGCHGGPIKIDNICFCYFYSDGIIPIVDSIVDYSEFDRFLSVSLESEYYRRIRGSNYSIYQGYDVDEAVAVIRTLIEKGVYGGVPDSSSAGSESCDKTDD